jgi:hypothetical protein
MRGISLAALAVLALLPPSQSPPQAPAAPAAGGTVGGRVIHALTKEPLRGAIVTAGRTSPGDPGAAPATAFLTNADGTFVLRDVPAGPVTLSASKTGYLTAHGTAAATMVAGGRIDDVLVALTPTALLSGRVLDFAGDPVAQAAVRVVSQGEDLGSQAARSTTTDDRGTFVVDGLAAGTYVVGAARSVAESMKIPSVTAQTVAVEPGEERSGVYMQVPWPPAPPATAVMFTKSGQRTAAPVLGTSSIAGTVRNSHDRGRAHARVMATRAEDVNDTRGMPQTWVATTDERGAFLIQGLPAGSFVVAAGTSGAWTFFHGGAYPHHPGPPVPLDAGELKRGVDIVIPEPGGISGTIRDEFGDPVRATVTLFAGTTRGIGSVARKTTDDRGRYRFGSLRPGQYLIMADRETSTPLHADDGAGGVRTVGAIPVFHPGVPSYTVASVLHIDFGTELESVDVAAGHVPVARMQFSVIAPPGRSIESIAARGLAHGVPAPPIVPSRAEGASVVFDAVPAGHWAVVVSANVTTPYTAERYWSSAEISSDGVSPQRTTLMLDPGARASGRVVFDGDGPRPAEIEIWLSPTAPHEHAALPSSDPRVEVYRSGTFRMSGIGPGRYALQAGDQRSGGKWTLARATLGGADVLDLPIEFVAGRTLSDIVLTVTDRLTELSGRAADATGRPLAAAQLVIVPADARYHWLGSRRLQDFVTDHEGRYVVRVPPGDYLVGEPPRAILGASLLLAPGDLTAAARVTLAAGDRRVQDVRIAR